MATYHVPAGTPVGICRVREVRNWRSAWLSFRDYTTKKPLTFTGFEHFSGGTYIFKEGGWLLLVVRRYVTED